MIENTTTTASSRLGLISGKKPKSPNRLPSLQIENTTTTASSRLGLINGKKPKSPNRLPSLQIENTTTTASSRLTLINGKKWKRPTSNQFESRKPTFASKIRTSEVYGGVEVQF